MKYKIIDPNSETDYFKDDLFDNITDAEDMLFRHIDESIQPEIVNFAHALFEEERQSYAIIEVHE